MLATEYSDVKGTKHQSAIFRISTEYHVMTYGSMFEPYDSSPEHLQGLSLEDGSTLDFDLYIIGEGGPGGSDFTATAVAKMKSDLYLYLYDFDYEWESECEEGVMSNPLCFQYEDSVGTSEKNFGLAKSIIQTVNLE